MSLGERLDVAIKAAGLSQSEVARRVPCKVQQVNQIVKNQRQLSKHLARIAEVIGVSVHWLTTGQGDWKPPHMPDAPAELEGDSLLIPTVGSAAAAMGASVDGEVDCEPPVRIRDRWRAVKIHGDSGYPVVLDGQTVLIDPALPCERNRIVVVHTDDGPQLKRIGDQLDDGRVMLASINAGLDPKLVRLSDYARAPEVVVGVVFTDSVAR